MSNEHGIDVGKKVKGHKRHIIVDIVGTLRHVNVHAANKSNTIAVCDALERAYERYPSIQAYSRDAGYRGTSSVKFSYEKINLTLHYFSEKMSRHLGGFTETPGC